MINLTDILQTVYEILRRGGPGKNGQETKYIFMCLLWNIVNNHDVKIHNITRSSGKN
jgi:hypothetical protein